MGCAILTAVSEEVLTSTRQSKSTSRGRDTAIIITEWRLDLKQGVLEDKGGTVQRYLIATRGQIITATHRKLHYLDSVTLETSNQV